MSVMATSDLRTQSRTRGTRRASLLSACSAVSALIVVAATTFSLAAQQPPPPGGGRGAAPPRRQDFPKRPPGDPAAIERGKALYGVNCQFCHGADTRGGDGGPSLLRTATVLDDQRGELIGAVVKNGRPDRGMPKFSFRDEQIADIAAFIHTFTAAGYDESRSSRRASSSATRKPVRRSSQRNARRATRPTAT